MKKINTQHGLIRITTQGSMSISYKQKTNKTKHRTWVYLLLFISKNQQMFCVPRGRFQNINTLHTLHNLLPFFFSFSVYLTNDRHYNNHNSNSLHESKIESRKATGAFECMYECLCFDRLNKGINEWIHTHTAQSKNLPPYKNVKWPEHFFFG